MNLLTVREVCSMLKLTPDTLRKLRADGMPSLTVGKRERFRADEVLAWLDRQQDTKKNESAAR